MVINKKKEKGEVKMIPNIIDLTECGIIYDGGYIPQLLIDRKNKNIIWYYSEIGKKSISVNYKYMINLNNIYAFFVFNCVDDTSINVIEERYLKSKNANIPLFMLSNILFELPVKIGLLYVEKDLVVDNKLFITDINVSKENVIDHFLNISSEEDDFIIC